MYRRDPSAQSPERARLPLALLAAIVIHAVLLALVGPALDHGDAEPYAPVRELDPMELVTITEEQTDEERNREELEGQFVSLPEPEVEETPEEAHFRDQYDRRTDEETVARDRAAESDTPESAAQQPQQQQTRQPGERVERPSPPRRSDQTNDRVAARREARERDRRNPAEGERAPGEDSTQESASPTPLETLSEDEERAEPESASPSEGAGTGSGERRLDLGAFNPSLDNAREIVGGRGRSVDYLDLPEGERTAINSLQSIYWSFFQRMKEKLRREWQPGTVLRRHDPTGNLYGDQDRYTSLRVTLNPDGTLRRAYVERSSALDFFDQEAIRAFRAAQPFPNVPEGMKNEHGLVTFRFGFHLDVNRRTTRIEWIDFNY